LSGAGSRGRGYIEIAAELEIEVAEVECRLDEQRMAVVPLTEDAQLPGPLDLVDAQTHIRLFSSLARGWASAGAIKEWDGCHSTAPTHT
jgi:hypothetical protein